MPELLVAPTGTPAPLRLPEPPELALAPTDEYGMPYPIHPYEAPRGERRTWSDDHHSFYQKKARELQGDAGRAVRYSRCLTVARWLHNNFHEAYPGGTDILPRTEQDKFAITVLAVAGYMPRQALDVRDPGNPGLVAMSGKTYDFVRGRKQMHYETKQNRAIGYRNEDYAARHIGKFFAAYAQKQDLTSLSQRDIKAFLSSGNTERRRRLGMKILREAIEMAVEPVDPVYGQALEEGLVKKAKPCAADVVTLVFPEERWPEYFSPLRRQLLGAA
ncbi:MAG: hypothetical protein WAQ57_04345 [Candidatus Saccharimonadales bacterium]